MLDRIKRSMFVRMLTYFAGGGMVLFFLLIGFRFCLADRFSDLTVRLKDNGLTYNELLAIQISVTFIVVSVVTAFAQKNDVIYWEDSMHYKLERPVLTNFCALSSYLFADLLFSMGTVVAGSDFVYFTFSISILLLMLLSYRMIAAFFMHDQIKNQLERDFASARENRRSNRASRDRYRDYKRKTIQNSLVAIEENDVETVCENLSFLYRFDEKEDADHLIHSMLEYDRVFMLSSAVKACRFIFSRKEEIEYFFALCVELVDHSAHNAGFAKSIIRAMGECIVIEKNNDDFLRSCYELNLNDFIAYLSDKGLDEVVNIIRDNYEKQLNGFYSEQETK